MFNTMELLRKQKNAGFEDEQARKKAKWDDEDRAIKGDERKRAEELRTQLQADAAPVEVEEVEQAGPLQPDAAPMPAMSQIKGKTFASRELADKAATEQNAPQAVMQRQSMTALRAGNPEGAARVMETGMKLGEAERKIAHEAFQRRVDGTFAWGDLAKFLDEAGDPNMKGRFRPSEDGKTMVMERVNPDSSVEKLTEFPNTTEGFAKARAIARGMTAEQLFKHEDLVQAREDALAQRKAEGEQRHKEHLERMAAIRASRAGGNGGGSGRGEDPVPTPGQIDMGAIDRGLRELYTTTDPETKIAKRDTTAHAFLRQLALEMPSAQTGDVEGAILDAHERYQAAMKVAGGDHGKAVAIIRNKTAPGPAPAPAPGPAPAPPTGAMAEIAAERQAKAKVEADKRAAEEAAKQQKRAAAAQITTKQIETMPIADLLRLQRSEAGRNLPREVRTLIDFRVRQETQSAPGMSGLGF